MEGNSAMTRSDGDASPSPDGGEVGLQLSSRGLDGETVTGAQLIHLAVLNTNWSGQPQDAERRAH